MPLGHCALMLVDSHCHLDFPEFSPELDNVLSRARDAGVGHFLTIGTELAAFPRIRSIAESADDIHCSIGVHPHSAAKEPLGGPEVLLKECGHPKVVAIGETGLDYYYKNSPRDEQIADFRVHIQAARQASLPLIVHTRDAEDDTIEILTEEMKIGKVTGVLHCFTGSGQLAQAALKLGFYISASGIVTFKKADELRAVMREVPLDRLLVETDAPYLAPQPHRGKRNEPAFVVHTAEVLAELKGVSMEALADATTENFFRLFSKAKQ